MEGKTGLTNIEGLSFDKRDKRFLELFALLMSSKMRRNFSLIAIGASEVESTPQAIPFSI